MANIVLNDVFNDTPIKLKPNEKNYTVATARDIAQKIRNTKSVFGEGDFNKLMSILKPIESKSMLTWIGQNFGAITKLQNGKEQFSKENIVSFFNINFKSKIADILKEISDKPDFVTSDNNNNSSSSNKSSQGSSKNVSSGNLNGQQYTYQEQSNIPTWLKYTIGVFVGVGTYFLLKKFMK